METKDTDTIGQDLIHDEVKNKSMEEDYTKLIEVCGKSGAYQKILMIIFLVSSFVGYYILTLIPLMKELPPYKCIDYNDFNDNSEYDQYKNNKQFQIVKNEECIIKHCMKEEPMLSPLIIIADLYYNFNLVADFRMFCFVDEFIGKITQSLTIGRLVGMLTFSYVSDKYGRRITFFIQFYIILVSLFLIGIVKSTFMFYILISVFGVASQIFVVTIVICSEVFDQTNFSMFNGLVNSFFPLSGLINVMVMYFTKNWTISLFLFLAIMSIIGFFSHKYVLESPSILKMTRNYEELYENLKFIAKINNNEEAFMEVKQNIDNENKIISPLNLNIDFNHKTKMISQTRRRSIKNLIKVSKGNDFQNDSALKKIIGPYYIIFSSSQSAFKMLICSFLFFSMFFVYFGLLLNLDKLEGDLYLHNVIVYSSEMIAELMAGYILSKFKRILIMFISNVACLICCLILFYGTGIVAELSLFGLSFFISMNFVVIICYTAEIFEPSIRSTATSIGFICGSLSLIFMPYILLLANNPVTIFIIMLLVNFLFFTRLKETKLDDSNKTVHH